MRVKVGVRVKFRVRAKVRFRSVQGRGPGRDFPGWPCPGLCRREFWLLFLLLWAGTSGWGLGSQGLGLPVTVAQSFPSLGPVCRLREQSLGQTAVLPSREGEGKQAKGRAGSLVLWRAPCRNPFQVWCSVPLEERVWLDCGVGLTTHLRLGATSRPSLHPAAI